MLYCICCRRIYNLDDCGRAQKQWTDCIQVDDVINAVHDDYFIYHYTQSSVRIEENDACAAEVATETDNHAQILMYRFFNCFACVDSVSGSVEFSESDSSSSVLLSVVSMCLP